MKKVYIVGGMRTPVAKTVEHLRYSPREIRSFGS
jgi:hypothetical protein